MHVVSIEQLQNSQGEQYKMIGIVNEVHLSQGGPEAAEYWIEGVGGSGGLLSTNGVYFYPMYTATLACMQANDTIWPSGESGSCWPTEVMEYNSNDLRVFPNPSTGLFTFTPSTNAVEKHILDQQGRMLFVTSEEVIDLTGHPPGVYTAVLFTPAGPVAQRLIVLR